MAILQINDKTNESINHNHILKPLGDSVNLCSEERNKWNEWNIEIPKLVLENPDKIYINGQTNEKAVCLTFDDCPDIKNTPNILDILKQYNVKASFFFVGMHMEGLYDIVKRAYDEGHLILNHTRFHPDLTSISENEITEELIHTENTIYSITGKRPVLMRPPYGAVDKRVLDIISKNGYRTILWSINTFDWLEKTKDNIIKNILNNIRPGDITLMHSFKNKEPTVEALSIIISELRLKGYRFLNLAEMLGIEAYKV